MAVSSWSRWMIESKALDSVGSSPQHPEVGRPGVRAMPLGVAGTNEEPVRPGVEARRVAKLWKVPPDSDQRLLGRVLGEIDVAQDPARHGEEPRRDIGGEQPEGCPVAALGPITSPRSTSSTGAASVRTTLTRYGLAAGLRPSIFDPQLGWGTSQAGAATTLGLEAARRGPAMPKRTPPKSAAPVVMRNNRRAVDHLGPVGVGKRRGVRDAGGREIFRLGEEVAAVGAIAAGHARRADLDPVLHPVEIGKAAVAEEEQRPRPEHEGASIRPGDGPGEEAFGRILRHWPRTRAERAFA